jgi:flagellar protein FliO/FliZ
LLRTLLLLFPVAAQASEAASPGVSSGTYLQAGFALILIVGLLAATAWMARKVSGGKGFGQAGLKVIGGVALGPRERIVLVEVVTTGWSSASFPGKFVPCIAWPRAACPRAPCQPVPTSPSPNGCRALPIGSTMINRLLAFLVLLLPAGLAFAQAAGGLPAVTSTPAAGGARRIR